MENDNLSFSAQIAETIGLESAVILDFYNSKKNNPIKSHEDIIQDIKKKFSFISNEKIEECLTKLGKFGLIDHLNKNTPNDKKNINIKTPRTNHGSKRIDIDWAPSSETKEILQMTDIESDFYELKLKEFIIYWSERGQKKNNWNITFLDFIRREWAKEKNSLKIMPHLIDENWFPDDEVFDILNLSDITKDIAVSYLKEFILYWKDKGVALNTWNSKFIDHVKRRRLMDTSNNEKSKEYSEPGKYSQDFKTRKNDNSWATEINLD